MSETPYGQDGTAAERPVDSPTDAGRPASEVAATIDAQVDEVTEQAAPSAAGPSDADVTARVDSEVLLPAVAGGSTVQDEGGGAVTTGKFEAERADRSISLSSQVDETADGAEASATAAPAGDHASGTAHPAAQAGDHASGTADLAATAGDHASGPAHLAATHGEVDQAAADAGAGAQAASGANAGTQAPAPGSAPVSASDQVDQTANGPDTGQAGPRSTSIAAGGQVDEAAGGGRRGSTSAAEGGAAELEDPERLRAAVEAVLLVVDTPTSATDLALVLGRPVAEVEEALRSLQADYDAGGRGMDLREVAEGWRLYSREDFAPYVERFVLDGQQARLTQAALETLAVIAYRQPVTRSRIAGIRGVSVDAVMRTLLTRGLVEECGADPDTGGGLYRTTRLFLEKVGLRSLDELPSLAPLLPDTSQLDDVAVST